MSTNRRNFLKLSARASGSVGLSLITASSNLLVNGNTAGAVMSQATKPLRILILGGTGFIGPVHVEGLRRAGIHVAGIVGSSPQKSPLRAPPAAPAPPSHARIACRDGALVREC